MKKLFLNLVFLSTFSFAFEELDSSNFEQKIKGKNLIIEFFAHWCQPCKDTEENLDFYSQTKSDDVEIFKVNVELNKQLAFKYEANSLPTLVYVKDGKVVLTQKGFQNYNQIEQNVKTYILKTN